MADDPNQYTNLAGAFAGGAAFLKIFDRVIRAKRRTNQAAMSDAAAIREELRLQVKRLDEHISTLTRDLDTWKAKYYALAEENLGLKTECHQMRVEISALQSLQASSPRQPSPSVDA